MRRFILLSTLCFFTLAGVPRFFSLEAYWGSDEGLWLQRSAQFMSTVKKGEFSETLIAYHPGVTTMWLAGLRSFFIDPRVDVENLALARGFIGVLVWVGIGIASLLLYQLFGQWIALASFACLAYSPFFLTQTRRVHTDALATTFILLTVLLFLLSFHNRRRHCYLIFSGIAFGLAVLSKSYALILLPWIPLCLFLFREKHTGGLGGYLAESIIFLNCASLTLLSLWPVFWTPIFCGMALCLLGLTCVLFREMKGERCPMWLVGVALVGLLLVSIHVTQTASTVFDKVNWAVTTPHEVEHFFLGEVVNDPGWLFYIFVLTIKSTPLMLPLVLLGCILLWKNRKHSEETARHFKTGLALVFGAVLFTICLSATSKKFSRYLLPAFALLEILAAIGFIEGLKWGYTAIGSKARTEAPAKYKTALVVVAGVVFFFLQVVPVLVLHPYYGTYYNPYWKVTDITNIITVGDASGVALAAKYIENKPNAPQLRVAVSPLGTDFFQPYFRGFAYNTKKKYLSADYEVVYIRDSQIKWVPQAGTRGGILEHIITLNGIDYVWIYRIPDQETP